MNKKIIIYFSMTLMFCIAVFLILGQRMKDADRVNEVASNSVFGIILPNGSPPYESDVLIGKFGALNGIVNHYMDSHAHVVATSDRRVKS